MESPRSGVLEYSFGGRPSRRLYNRLLPADEAHDCVVCDSDIGPHDPDRMTGGDTRLLKQIAFNEMPGTDSHLR
jgi:hypothetical protein